MNNSQPILVTGGAGFIGSNFVHDWVALEKTPVVVLDSLTYAGNLDSLRDLMGTGEELLTFVQGDITDSTVLKTVFSAYRPRGVVHFAAESHVDRSIDGPEEFVMTNVVGTFRMLEGARAYYSQLEESEKSAFRFLHVSTDEVYGTLPESDPNAKFRETTPYKPHSPYSASKASSDHFVRAYCDTYGLPTMVTNCSNNYGPYQFPEKLLPLMILNCLEGKPLPVYGDGLNVRDWLYVGDHCSAIRTVLAKGEPGQTYNIGGNNERQNIEIVKTICKTVDRLCPGLAHGPCESLITYVKDRPGHDRRYAIDSSKIQKELGWTPAVDFESGIEKTVQWYLDNRPWCENVTSGKYRRERLGKG